MDVRERIANRLRDKGLSMAWLSAQIGRNAAYIQQYLRRGVPSELELKDRIEIARVLEMSLAELDVPESVMRSLEAQVKTIGFGEGNAAPYEPGPGRHPMLSASPALGYLTMTTDDLDQAEPAVQPRDVLVFDLNANNVTSWKNGQIVWLQLADKAVLGKSHGSIVGQFLRPNKICSNSARANWILSLDDETLPFEMIPRGALKSVVHEVS